MRRLLGAAVLLLSLAAAAQAPPAERRARASQERMTGFFVTGPVPFTDAYQRGDGSVSIEVTDRVAGPRTEGDTGRLSASFSVDGAQYLVELSSVGFARDSALAAEYQEIEGGVVLDRQLHGSSGLGSPMTTEVRTGLALWGVGRVTKNGRLLSDRAVIMAAALTAGSHADDDTHRLLPETRPGDAEIEVLAMGLNKAEERRGFIQFHFDEVQISLEGVPVAAELYVDTVPRRLPEDAAAGFAAAGVSGVRTSYGGPFNPAGTAPGFVPTPPPTFPGGLPPTVRLE